jgi:hypothetical protein
MDFSLSQFNCAAFEPSIRYWKESFGNWQCARQQSFCAESTSNAEAVAFGRKAEGPGSLLGGNETFLGAQPNDAFDVIFTVSGS